jgi:hypothetical protein
MTPQNRYHEDLSEPAEILTISILRRPLTRRARQITHMMPEELTRAVTLQQDYNRAHKKYILHQRLQRVKNTNIQHKDPNHTEDQIRRSMNKNTN